MQFIRERMGAMGAAKIARALNDSKQSGGAPDGRYKRSTNFVKNVQNGSKVWLPFQDAWSNETKLEAILAGLARAQVKDVPQPLTREFLTATKGKGFQVPNTALQHESPAAPRSMCASAWEGDSSLPGGLGPMQFVDECT